MQFNFPKNLVKREKNNKSWLSCLVFPQKLLDWALKQASPLVDFRPILQCNEIRPGPQ